MKEQPHVNFFGFIVAAIMCCSQTVFADDWVRVIDLERHWRFSIGDNKKWAEAGYDDQRWETIEVPSKWEDEGFNGYNGYAWYRITFDGASLKNRNAVYNLFLGYIDDVDEAYLNGVRIGSSGTFPPKFHTAYNALRNYYLPSENIKWQGKNVIAVRVYDSEIEGGIVSGDVGVFMNKDDQSLTINLRGSWDFSLLERKLGKRNYSTNEIRTPPLTAKWTKLTVPGLWEHQGYHDYDGSAWYRKQFMVPKQLEGEDLVLLLGKIDDFDQTYLNGRLVGSTNQYDKERIYHITSDIVNAGAMNLLLIYVDDPQGDGGIYSGPIGIIKQSEFTRYMRYRRD